MNELGSILRATGEVGSWVVIIFLFITGLFRFLPRWRELGIGSDDSLRQDLMGEIVRLRADNADERRDCDKKMEAMAKEHREQLIQIGLRHDEAIRQLKDEISGLHNEMRQIVSSQARSMNAPILSQLTRTLPTPPDMSDLIARIDEADDDAGQ